MLRNCKFLERERMNIWRKQQAFGMGCYTLFQTKEFWAVFTFCAFLFHLLCLSLGWNHVLKGKYFVVGIWVGFFSLKGQMWWNSLMGSTVILWANMHRIGAELCPQLQNLRDHYKLNGLWTCCAAGGTWWVSSSKGGSRNSSPSKAVLAKSGNCVTVLARELVQILIHIGLGFPHIDLYRLDPPNPTFAFFIMVHCSEEVCRRLIKLCKQFMLCLCKNLGFCQKQIKVFPWWKKS